MDKKAILGLIFLTVSILLYFAVHFVAIPYTIVAIAGAFGFTLSYWLGLGIWLLLMYLLNMVKSK